MIPVTLRVRLFMAIGAISALLTSAVLFIVRQRVQAHAEEQVAEGLNRSLLAFRNLQKQREATLESSAALLAALPPVMAVMTAADPATIQDASKPFWALAGSQLFVLADSEGHISALHSSTPGLPVEQVEAPLRRLIQRRESRDWWYTGGHLFQIFLQPVRFGSGDTSAQIGVLALGFEADQALADSIAGIAASEVAFVAAESLVVTTVEPGYQLDLKTRSPELPGDGTPVDLNLAGERFRATRVRLASGDPPVALIVLESYDRATRFLTSLNRWIVAAGLAGVLAGAFLAFLVASSVTRPLDRLVQGVRALEAGDFDYPLTMEGRGTTEGRGEVSTLTAAFDRMRRRLKEQQKQLLAAERLATIGRMATTISHDLRHPLTAILAYAEFLSEDRITEAQRRDFFREIRIAVNRMTDELNSLLGFSKQGERLMLAECQLEDVVERAIQNIRVLPEYRSIQIHYVPEGNCAGVFDPAKMERVVENLLFNACQAVAPNTGVVHVISRSNRKGLEIRVTDNGPGIPEEIRPNLFQPFVSHGKEKGIGLGLTVVQKIVEDHGGSVRVDKTGPGGSEFVVEISSPVGPSELIRSA
ncbi:MAG: HAMP domain-containing sensor histidine kinase [Bryobacteraceae bacterium]